MFPGDEPLLNMSDDSIKDVTYPLADGLFFYSVICFKESVIVVQHISFCNHESNIINETPMIKLHRHDSKPALSDTLSIG